MSASIHLNCPDQARGCPTNLVDFAITNAVCAGEPADGVSESRRSGDAARARDEGGAGRSSREGGNAAVQDEEASVSSMAANWQRGQREKVHGASLTNLLNILRDDQQQLRMGWKVVMEYGERKIEEMRSTTKTSSWVPSSLSLPRSSVLVHAHFT